jgi:hypothetical protein
MYRIQNSVMGYFGNCFIIKFLLGPSANIYKELLINKLQGGGGGAPDWLSIIYTIG